MGSFFSINLIMRITVFFSTILVSLSILYFQLNHVESVCATTKTCLNGAVFNTDTCVCDCKLEYFKISFTESKKIKR